MSPKNIPLYYPIKTLKTFNFNRIFTKYKDNYYKVCIQNDKIEMIDTNNNNIINLFTNLSYKDKAEYNKIQQLLASFYHSLNKSNKDIIYKKKEDIENSVVYIFLMPFLTIKKEFIIKIGYTTNLEKRTHDLKREFNISELYLLLAMPIKNEAYEKKIHSILKNNFDYYPIEKVGLKKNDKIIICIETYKYSFGLIERVVKEVYEMSNVFNKSILELKNVELELKNVELALENAKVENNKTILAIKNTDNEKIILETNNNKSLLTLKNTELENNKTILAIKNTELAIKNTDNEKLSLEIENNKLLIELKKLESK